jgi:hypothetical protein
MFKLKINIFFMHLFNHLAFYIHWQKVFVENNNTKIMTDYYMSTTLQQGGNADKLLTLFQTNCFNFI